MSVGTPSKLVSVILIMVTLFVPVWSAQSRAEGETTGVSASDARFVDEQKKTSMYATYRWIAERLGKDPEDPLVIQGISNWAHGIGIGLIVGLYGAWKRQGDAKALLTLFDAHGKPDLPPVKSMAYDRAHKRMAGCANGWSLLYPVAIGGVLVAGSTVALSHLSQHVEQTEGTTLEGLDQRRKAQAQAKVLAEQDDQTKTKMEPVMAGLAPIFKANFGAIRANILDDPSYAGMSETERTNLTAKVEAVLAPAAVEQKVREYWNAKAHLLIRHKVAPGQKPVELLATIVASDVERSTLAREVTEDLFASVLGAKFSSSIKSATREIVQDSVNEALRLAK